MDVTAAATLFAWLNRELWLATSASGDRRGGLIATSVDPGSIVAELPRVMVTLSRQHHTTDLVEASNSFALHLLGEDNLEMVWSFGLESGRDRDKFAAYPFKTGETGCPLLNCTVGWLDCRVEAKLDVGDRVVYLAEVLEGRVHNFAPPLTMRRLMELAPASRLTQLQRSRHQHSYHDADAIRIWREQREKSGG